MRVNKIMGTRLAYYSRGPNPLFFSQDSDKLTSNVPLEPTIYFLFTQMTQSQSSPASINSDAVHVYIKQNVETFLFRGADLMWPGVLSVSKSEFKPNTTGIVFAHKALVNKYISSLANREQNEMDDESQEERKEAQAAAAQQEEGEEEEGR